MDKEQINSCKEFQKDGCKYQQLPPHKDLESFVNYFFVSEGAGPPADDKIKLMLVPDGHFDILWHSGSHFEYEIKETGQSNSNELIIAGQMTRASYLNINFPVTIIGAKLFAHALHPLVKTHLCEFTDKVFNFEDIFEDSKELIKSMRIAGDKFEALRLLQSYLINKYSKCKDIDEITVNISREFFKESGNITLKEIARIYDISPRQIERKFDRFIGQTPKMLSRAIRFSGCLAAIQRSPGRKTLEVIHSFGYYDQTHFIKEFKDFVKLTPNEYKKWINSFMDKR
jgi:AraC-like DNA-binding protein